ncbi:zinc finger, RING/FYVE/PHD-type [Artemisia annua]|uniref:Zinc finger, RING/FYVE/PHD-type n=1 Tax=Artemisia annua TaxID=35608 RepID=A0A2U1L8C6_ARTAN|nr:zinc finger, RING/FYVE/PHD-type [Artemisia annua]
MVETWVGSDGKTTLEGLEVDWPILGRNKNISVFKDVCSICFKAMTGTGQHRICCLPCGHIYGRSCINQWLQQSQNCSKCPQCKSLCTLKDVTPLYATRPCDDAVGALPKGFKAFKRYAMRRLDDESAMRLDAARRRDYAVRQGKEIYRRWYYSAAAQQPDKYNRLANKFLHRDHMLDRRKWALKLRIEDYHASIDLFVQRYNEHMTRDKNQCKGMATIGLPRIPSESSSLTPSPSGIDLSYLHVPERDNGFQHAYQRFSGILVMSHEAKPLRHRNRNISRYH